MKTTAVLKVLKANKQRGGGDAEAETKVKKVSKKKKTIYSVCTFSGIITIKDTSNNNNNKKGACK